MTNGGDDRSVLIASISEGDSLDALHVMTLNAVWQDLRPEANPIRPKLRSMGIGHSFFKGEMWFLPVDGGDAGFCTDKLIGMLASTRGRPEVVEVDPTDDLEWNGVIKRVARDAIAVALANRARANGTLMARGSKILDRSERLPGATKEVYVLPGLDFHRVYRATHGRLLVACAIVFEAFDENERRPTETAVVTASCNKAYAHSADNRWAWVERTSQKVLPLEMAIGDRKLTLRRIGVPIGSKKAGSAWF